MSAPGGVGMGGGPSYGAAGTFPYSYYAAAPAPARAYVGYGSNDLFPYRGQPYGRVYDRYSWSTLSGANTLARYYYPPVR